MIQYQKLFQLIRANESLPLANFDLGSWRSICGTTCCLVGNDIMVNHSERSLSLKLMDDPDGIYYGLDHPDGATEYACEMIALEYGITPLEADFLFDVEEIFSNNPASQTKLLGMRDVVDRDAALNRVRKFLYYKLHKAEILYTEDGRVRESARQAGDIGVNRHVTVRMLQTT